MNILRFRSRLLPILSGVALGASLAATGVDSRAAQPGQYPVQLLKPNERPEELKGVGIQEHLGARVSLDELTFRDETGQSVKLSRYFKSQKPVVLNLVYYSCPSLCSYVLNGFLESLKGAQWTAGEQFEIVTVSIDPREGPELAASKKKSFLESYGRPGAEEGWHFLTGDESQIKRLASEVGFGYRYVENQDEYAHSAAIFILTPDGRISRYLYGITFPQRDFRLALLEASNGKIGTVADRIMMFCFRYDSEQRGYSLYVFRLAQVGTAGGMVFVGGYMLVFWRRQSRRKAKEKGPGERA